MATGILFIALGALLVYKNDTRNNDLTIYTGTPNAFYLAILTEQPVEKAKTKKVAATITIIEKGHAGASTGAAILYFQKDSCNYYLTYGTKIIFRKPLQEIKDNHNPGAFNYKQYCLFQGITHQVYLLPGEYTILNAKKRNRVAGFIFSLRKKVLESLQQYISPRKETGLAEALLIGYKDDLDKTLVQSYSNTGVVHIIAISGLHLSLIYWLLLILLRPIHKGKKPQWLSSLLIITGLWAFTLIAGAQPSILRSAVMFTLIASAETLSRKTTIYNTLTLSAFVLLCYNPFWLWDIGFQLSYAAIISILLFSKPVYNLLYFDNKLVDQVWKLVAVSIAAQVLTLPITLYYFHQFPAYFLLTNLLAVPLSSLILFMEIVLCCFSAIPFAAVWMGKLTGWLIWLMNTWIEKIESLPFSLWEKLQVTALQAILLTLFLVLVSYALLNHSTPLFKSALIILLALAALRSAAVLNSMQQQQVLVYNVPRHSAIDWIYGRHIVCTGDSSLQIDSSVQHIYLAPSRLMNRATATRSIPGLTISIPFISFGQTHVLWFSQPVLFQPAAHRQRIDLLLLSGHADISIEKLDSVFAIGQVVIDATAPSWKKRRVQAACDSLGLPCHDVTLKGAFAMHIR